MKPYFSWLPGSLVAWAAIHDVVEECQAAVVARAGESLAQQLMLSCVDDTSAIDCVPTCNETLHGDLLLANIDGEVSNLPEND